MADDIYIEIPESVTTDEELMEFIHESADLFYEALDLNVIRYVERATVKDFSFNNFEFEKDEVIIYYTFSYEAYYGCKDHDYSGDSAEASIKGKRIGNQLVFPKYVDPEPPSTYEEF